MPRTDEQRKEVLIKWLAVVGVVASALVLAWLAVAAVRLLPSTFATLASLIESAEPSREELTLEENAQIVKTGEETTLAWTGSADTYAFAYACTEGVSAELVSDSGRAGITCDTPVLLAEGARSVTVVFSSEKHRFADVRYAIHIVGADGITSEGIATVINSTIRATGTAREEEPVGDADEEEVVATVTEEVSDTPVSPAQPERTYPDLAISLIGVGAYSERTGILTPSATLREGERVALQFLITNVGTGTSDIWYYDAALPTHAGGVFRSGPQEPLAPGSGLLITLGFEASRAGIGALLSVVVGGGNDAVESNNILLHTTTIRR